MAKEGFTQVVNFMTPGAVVLVLRGDHSYMVKYYFLLKSFSVLFCTASIDQTKHYVVMMTKDGSTKIVNYMTPRIVLLC